MGVYGVGDSSSTTQVRTDVSLIANVSIKSGSVAFVTKAGSVIPGVVSDFSCQQNAGTVILGPVLCNKTDLSDHPVYGIVFGDVSGGIVVTNVDGTSRAYITPSSSYLDYVIRDDGNIVVLESPEVGETLPSIEVFDGQGNVLTPRTALTTNVTKLFQSFGDNGIMTYFQKNDSTITIEKLDDTNTQVYSIDVASNQLSNPVSGPYGTLISGNTIISPKGSLQSYGNTPEVTVYPDKGSTAFSTVDIETAQILSRVDIGNVVTSMKLPSPVVSGVMFNNQFFYLDAFGSLRGIASIGDVAWSHPVENGFTPDTLVGDAHTNSLIVLEKATGNFEVYDINGFMLTPQTPCGLTDITSVCPQTDGTAVFLGASTISNDTTDGMFTVTKTFDTQCLGIVDADVGEMENAQINVTKGIYSITPMSGKQSVTFPAPTENLPYGASGFLMGKTFHTSGV